MLIIDLLVKFVSKELSRRHANQQLSVKNLASWLAGRRKVRDLSYTLKESAVKSVMDGIKAYAVERRSIGKTTGDGTMDVDVQAERRVMEKSKARILRKTSAAMQELLEKANSVLSHTGETSKARKVTCGSARRRPTAGATAGPSVAAGATDKDIDAGDQPSPSAPPSGTRFRTISESEGSDLDEGELRARLTPRGLVASRRSTHGAAADTTSTPSPETAGTTLPPPNTRGGSSGWSVRMFTAEQEGRAERGEADSFGFVMCEGMIAKASAAEKKTDVAAEALKAQEAAAERRAMEEATKAERQFSLDEKRQRMEQIVAERSVADEDRKVMVSERRAEMEAMLARADVYKKQLDVFGKMFEADPRPDLVASAQDATEAFSAAGEASLPLRIVEERRESSGVVDGGGARDGRSSERGGGTEGGAAGS